MCQLHERTLRAASTYSFTSLESPWPVDSGPGALDEELLCGRPIWALPALVARFGFDREDEVQRKECKRMAAVLAEAFS